MATETNKNPNDRPRDCHGHFIKSGNAKKKPASPAKKKPSKAATAAKKDAGCEDIDVLTIKVLELDSQKPSEEQAPTAYIEHDGCPYVSMKLYDALLKRYAETFKRNRNLFRDNTVLIKALKDMRKESDSLLDYATGTLEKVAAKCSRDAKTFWLKILLAFLVGVPTGGLIVRLFMK